MKSESGFSLAIASQPLKKKKTQNEFLRISYKLQEDNSAAVKKQAEGASNPMYQVV